MEFDIDDQIENAIEWIEALAGNEFKQCRARLGDIETGMCCLGVANHLFNIGLGILRAELPPINEVGLSALSDGFYSPSQLELVHLNDLKRYTHSQIAGELVKEPRKYFTPEVAEGVEEHFYMGSEHNEH